MLVELPLSRTVRWWEEEEVEWDVFRIIYNKLYHHHHQHGVCRRVGRHFVCHMWYSVFQYVSINNFIRTLVIVISMCVCVCQSVRIATTSQSS